MINLLQLIESIDDYVKFGRRSDLKYLKTHFSRFYLHHELSIDKRKLNEYPDSLKDPLRQLFIILNLEPTLLDSDPYQSLTFVKLFVRLCRETEDPLIYEVTKIIEAEVSNVKWLYLIGFFLGAALLSTTTLNNSAFNFIKKNLKLFFNSVKGLPIIGIIFSVVGGLFRLGSLLLDDKKSNKTKKRNGIFIGITIAFNVIAYSLLFSGLELLPIIGGFFVLAAITTSINHVFSLAYKEIQYHDFLGSKRSLTNLDEKTLRADLRIESGLKKQRTLLLIDLSSSVLLLGLVILSSFLPAGPAVMIGCLLGMVTVQIVKAILTRIIKHRAELKLENKLSKLDDDHSASADESQQSATDLEILPQRSLVEPFQGSTRRHFAPVNRQIVNKAKIDETPVQRL